MFRQIFGSRPTTKSDIIMAVATAVIGVWKAADTIKEYRSEQEQNKENDQ